VILRILHLCVIVALVVAAAYVYDIKFESTLQAERVARLRGEIRRERDAVAALRAEWAKLDSPARIQALAQRHLQLQTMDARQVDNLANLPARPKPPLLADEADPIGALIGMPEDGTDLPTGSAGQRDAP
jgi:cell division protein FtsL